MRRSEEGDSWFFYLFDSLSFASLEGEEKQGPCFGSSFFRSPEKKNSSPTNSPNPTKKNTAFLKKIEGTLLSQVALQGVADIKKVFIRETERLVPDAAAQGGYAKESEWMLDTEGVNLLEVLCHPDVDATRTISNHLVEVIDVLGIEAGRGALLKEVRGVIEFDGEDEFFPSLLFSPFSSSFSFLLLGLLLFLILLACCCLFSFSSRRRERKRK